MEHDNSLLWLNNKYKSKCTHEMTPDFLIFMRIDIAVSFKHSRELGNKLQIDKVAYFIFVLCECFIN